MAEFKYRVEHRAHEPQLEIESLKFLGSNELLFAEGELKTALYRVEIGAVCLYRPRYGESDAPLQFAFAGDWLALGFLEKHTMRARALVDTYLTCLPRTSVHAVVEQDRRAKAQLADANEQEFEFARRSILGRGSPNPTQRVAAFLISLASINRNEGRDPCIVAESVKCGTMAECLGLSISALRSVLVTFARQGLVEVCPPGKLRLNDLAALEAIADEIPLERSEMEHAAWRRSLAVDYSEIAEVA